MTLHDQLTEWGFSQIITDSAYLNESTGVEVRVFVDKGKISFANIEGTDAPNCNSLPILYTILYALGITDNL